MTMQVTLGFCPLSTDAQPSEGGSWDEVYYTSGDSIADIELNWLNGRVLATGSQTTQGYLSSVGGDSVVGKRLLALSSSCEIYYVRAAKIDAPRKSKLLRARLRGRAGISYKTSLNLPSDVNATGFAFRVADADGRGKRTILLRGVADAWVQGGTLTDEGGAAVSEIMGQGGFLRSYATNAGAIYRRQATRDGASSYAIEGAEQLAQNTNITIITNGGGAFPAGTVVDLVGVNSPPLRGRWVCAGNPAVNKLILRGSFRYSAPLDLTGRVVRVTKENSALDQNSFAFAGITSKKTGKKKFQPRGRQSAQLIRK